MTDDDFGEEPPAMGSARRDPLLSIHRGHRHRRIGHRLTVPEVKIPTRLMDSAAIALGVVALGVVAVVFAGFAAHAFWDALMLGWRIAA